jgi:hypothetical protein
MFKKSIALDRMLKADRIGYYKKLLTGIAVYLVLTIFLSQSVVRNDSNSSLRIFYMMALLYSSIFVGLVSQVRYIEDAKKRIVYNKQHNIKNHHFLITNTEKGILSFMFVLVALWLLTIIPNFYDLIHIQQIKGMVEGVVLKGVLFILFFNFFQSALEFLVTANISRINIIFKIILDLLFVVLLITLLFLILLALDGMFDPIIEYGIFYGFTVWNGVLILALIGLKYLFSHLQFKWFSI